MPDAEVLIGVDVPLSPPPLSGVDVPVLGEVVPRLEEPGVDVPEPRAEVAASVETEVETEVDKLCVPEPVFGIAAVPVAELEGDCAQAESTKSAITSAENKNLQ